MGIKNTPETTQTVAEPEAAPVVEQSLDEKMLSAMDEGVTKESAPTEVPAEVVAEVEEKPEVVKTDAAKPEGETPLVDEAKPDTVALDAEVKDLDLKEKAAARFRALSTENTAFKPMREALDAAGIKDVAEIPALKARANNYDEMIALVRETGTSPEQYGVAMDLLSSINKARQGDATAASRAYDVLLGEMKQLAPMVGKDIPGVVDPLESFPDLAEAVESGDITRDYGLELAKQRSTADVSNRHRQAESDRTTSEQAQAQAKLDGVEALNVLGTELSAADGEVYKAKAPYLVAALRSMTAKTDPKLWRETALEIYRNLPTVAPAPAPVAVKKPPSGIGGAMSRPTLDIDTTDMLTAMDQGIAAAS